MICPNCKISLKTEYRPLSKGEKVWAICDQCGFNIPPNHLSIDEIFAFVSVDANDQEGVICANLPGIGPMPMIAADKDRLKDLIPIAKDISKGTIKVRLLRFSNRKVIEEF